MKLRFYFLLLFSIHFFNLIPLNGQLVVSQSSDEITLDEIPFLSKFNQNQYSTIHQTPFQKISVWNRIENSPNNVENILRLNFEYEDMDFINIYILGENYFYSEFIYNNIFEHSIPSGVYDIIVNYELDNKNYFVFKELVNIESETELNINMQDSKNKIVFDVLNEDNEKLRPGINAQILLNKSLIYSNDHRIIFMLRINFWSTSSSNADDPIWAFYTSDVSDRYEFVNFTHAISTNKTHYFPQYQPLSNISQSVDLYNDPTLYVYHEEEIIPTPLGQNSSVKRPILTSQNLWKNNIFEFSTYIENQLTNQTLFKIYTSSNLEENQQGGSTLASYGFLEERLNSVDLYYLHGNSISTQNNEIIYSSKNYIPHGNLLSRYNLLSDQSENGVLPFHQKFSFFSGEKVGKQGNNTPIFASAIRNNRILSEYIGRYGEARESDFVTSTFNIHQDGNLVSEGNYLELLGENFISPSLFEVTIENANIRVDGIAGKNSAKIIFDTRFEDKYPPSLKMLQFRNENSIVTDRFEMNETPFVRIAAGDFYFEDVYLRYKEGNTVEFYYSKSNEEQWNEVELIHYPEFFVMPGYGDYYEASLAGINPEGNDVWYDVKVICTDAAGNKQIQTISPAFQLNSTLNIVELNPSQDLLVYPNPFTDTLYFEIPEKLNTDYTIRVTDFSGKQILSQVRDANELKKIDLSFLSKGIYIFSIEVDGEIVSKKVIKK